MNFLIYIKKQNNLHTFNYKYKVYNLYVSNKLTQHLLITLRGNEAK